MVPTLVRSLISSFTSPLPTDRMATSPSQSASPHDSSAIMRGQSHLLSVGSSHAGNRKRRRESGSSGNQWAPQSPTSDVTVTNPRKGHKVSRACDHCKHRKAKCTGTVPCPKCVSKGIQCVYDAKYSRGRPRTPPPSDGHHNVRESLPAGEPELQQGHLISSVTAGARGGPASQLDGNGATPRAVLGASIAETETHIYESASGVSFLQRAWQRLAKEGQSNIPSENASTEQHIMLAGDRILPKTTEEDAHRLKVPPYHDLVDLIALYFDVCIATYRILHQPSVEVWMQDVEKNIRRGDPAWKDLGKARTAIVLACLAVATAHQEKSKGISSSEDDAMSLARSDHLFCVCMHLTETESGSPSLHSVQARIIQTLYLLTTSRMNRAWYTFGSAIQLISALGFHRKNTRQRHSASGSVDYLQGQLRIRTFWTAYILDKYLGVIFGRPRHYHDEDIDQDLPDRFEDKDLTPQGPTLTAETQLGCHIDGLIFHAQIARIIGQISRDVYTIRPISESERITAAHRLSKEIEEWKMSLPPYLVSIHPSMLITSYRRQSIVLKLGYCHAIMHANRLFLLATMQPGSKTQIDTCLGAAATVFEIVDGLARDGSIFHAFWWTHYVTFCALVVSYTWDIQLKRGGYSLGMDEQAKHTRLIESARQCHTHLAKATARNSPSRRYAVILEEFCSEAIGQKRSDGDYGGASLGESEHRRPLPNDLQPEAMLDPVYFAAPSQDPIGGEEVGYSLLDEWNTTDWLELDSSAFGPYMDIDSSSLWIPDIDLSNNPVQ